MMNRFVLLCMFSLACVQINASPVEKIQVSDDILFTFKENYRLFREKNAQKVAETEVSAHLGKNADLFVTRESVSFPICDFQRPPYQWKFVDPSDDQRVLKYVGKSGIGSQFLKWTDSVWARIGGPKESYREGMYCGGGQNFVAIDVDTSFAENVKYGGTRVELIDGVVLQLASKAVVGVSRVMQGEVKLVAASQLANARVGLELWSMGAEGHKLLVSTWERVNDENLQPKSIKVEANVDPQSQTLLVLRLDPALRDKAARGEAAGKLFLFAASLQPKD